MKPLEVRSVRVVGEAPRLAGDGWSLIGQDGGQSILLDGDRALFVFCDTMLSRDRAATALATPSPLADGERDGSGRGIFLANCAATAATSCSLRQALGELEYFQDRDGIPREILVPSIGEHLQGIRFWPHHGVGRRGRVFLYYLGIEQSGVGSWGFRPLGTGIAILDPESGRCERCSHRDDWRLWAVDERDLRIGVQVTERDGLAYVFLSSRTGTDRWAHLARVPFAEIATPSAYEYLVSGEPGWSDDPENLLNLGPCSNEYSVSFNRHLGGFLMTYVDGYDKSLYLRAAPELWGPYGDPVPVGRLPHDERSPFVFLAFEHPGYSRKDGETLYVSYCQPSFHQSTLVAVRLR